MESKREITDKAKELLLSNPDEALKSYRLLYDNYSDEFNDWDAFFAIKAMRMSNKPDLNWACNLAQKFRNDKVSNLYGWLIFDKCIKGKTRTELLSNEKIISELPGISTQKNCRVDDQIPCPTTIGLLSITKLYAKPSFNAIKIESFLKNLNVDFLSLNAKQSKGKEENDDEFASDFEKYLSLRSKSLFKIGNYQECKELSKLALETIEKFHYNNDVWFKMRIALSEDKLGNHETSEILLNELLTSRAGSDKWFLYRDIAEIYFEQGEYGKAWKYALEASFYGGEVHFLIGLFLLQTRILFKLQRDKDGRIIAELISSILKEQGWNDKIEYTRLFSFYNIDRNNLRSVFDLLKDVQEFWYSERYAGIERSKGAIISIHQSGKMGRIKTVKGFLLDFKRKDFKKKIRDIENLKGGTVEFYIMKSFDNKLKAESIEVIEQKMSSNLDSLVGKSFDGLVKNVTDFGIFFNFYGKHDGLLHKKNLPEDLKNNFREKIIVGSILKVKVVKITPKGVELIFPL